MLKSNVIESAIAEIVTKQGYALSAVDMLELRCRVAGTLAAKERHRQRMIAPEYHWRKPEPRR
ncbi:hypothetical protein ACKGJF_005511 [Raoultella ornithinolytica]|uniref:Uncharacterized protein n=1 Tax=Klebsiella michiganensis TaxID=1134687 RepID=A0AB35Q457_9ENTR|nr:hypothetical protein [Klebsiella michiganensis]MBW5974975.1 hypothetical protein [Klebsiella michiganensis]MBZ7221813.1 hypothetical protein [Klebsiella michiganensis]MCW9457400.1 hypothetical protein [Klebsiella michiganensis]MDQ7856894.1 hypothetical protein [Klebsiella michiganensis]MDS7751070.1 hypothetical protein [Klebsiella michiganensis]